MESPIVESPMTEPMIEVPVEDDWISEVEVIETDWGLEEDECDEVIDCESDSEFEMRDAEGVVARFPGGTDLSSVHRSSREMPKFLKILLIFLRSSCQHGG